MIFRCASCHGSVLAADPERLGTAVPGRCGLCLRRYEVTLPLPADDMQRDAKRLGMAAGVDSPSAYSILLEIMSLEQVRDLLHTTEVSPESERATDYDPAWDEAVQAGCLTAVQALQLGNRAALLARLMERHGLSRERASAVADRRLSLMQAVRMKEVVPDPVKPPKRERSRMRPVLAGVLVTLLAAAGLQLLLSKFGDDGARRGGAGRLQNETLAWTQVHWDEAGRVIEIVGPDAQSVLRAYCAANPAARRQPLELARPAADAGVRLGIFRDASGNGPRHAITIRRSGGARRWVAGDGIQPIAVSESPVLLSDTPRFALQ